jgi:hypothetical protein
MTWAIALTAFVTLGLSGDPVHADGEKRIAHGRRTERPGALRFP